jgi:lipopolysaccharide export system ATP-binding protein
VIGPQLLFSRVVKRYGDRAVVNDVTLGVPQGTAVALAGVNGSGKSTLFRIAAGFVEPTGGAVEISGGDALVVPLGGLHAESRVGQGLHYISQERRLIHGLSTLDNLRVAKTSTGGMSRVPSSDVIECLRELRLMHLLGIRPRDMGAPDVVRLLLAKAYLTNARFLLADEPFAGLGRADIDHSIAIMRRMCERGTGILITDHNPAPLLEMSDAVHIMQSGSIVFSGSAREARASAEAAALYFRRRA